MEARQLTPITVITGHLGSGKTTFIQKVLKSKPETNFLVIENEFGEVGIDGEILKGDQNALVELNNGCVCCNIQSDLEMILQKFIAEKHDIGHIIIEATGVANPAKIAKQFVSPNYLSNFFELTSVIAVLDGLHYQKHQKLPEFELQLLTSDQFYISKIQEKEKIEEIKREFHLPEKSVFISSSSPEQPEELSWFFKKNFFKLDSTISQKGGHSHYQKLAFELEGEFDPFTLENYLNVLFMQYMGRIFRSKGILYFRKYPAPIIFQGVFDSLDFQDTVLPNDGKKINRIVFIGHDLNEEKILSGLKNCLA